MQVRGVATNETPAVVCSIVKGTVRLVYETHHATRSHILVRTTAAAVVVVVLSDAANEGPALVFLVLTLLALARVPRGNLESGSHHVEKLNEEQFCSSVQLAALVHIVLDGGGTELLLRLGRYETDM